VADRFPATFLQEWYADAHDSGWSDLAVAIPVRLAPGHDERHVRQALADLTARHEALRTTLVRTEQGLRQEVAATGTIPCTVAARAEPRPFEVCGGALAGAVLERDLAGGVLVVYAHHAICDGWSAGIIHRDLTELCEARRDGRPPRLPELALQFADFACWEHEIRRRPVPRYWRDRLGDRPRLRLDVDPAALGRPARLHETSLPSVPPHSARALAALAASLRTTRSRLLGALVVATLRPFADDRVRIGLIASNRHRPELRDTVGDLWDQLPVTVDVSGEPTLSELATRYDGEVTAAQDHHVPLAVLAPLLGPGPLFDVRVNHFPDTVPDDDVRVRPRPHVVDRWWPGLALIDFQFRDRADGGVDCHLLVNVAAVPAERIDAITARFAEVVAAVAQPVGGRC
jgi:hypothetical protein